MNANQFGGVLRAILAAGAGYLVGKGILDQAAAEQIIGGLVTVGVAAWSVWTNRKPA